MESPTHMAIMRNSKGNVRPIAATAASPIVAAYAMSTNVKAERIRNDTTRGAAILRRVELNSRVSRITYRRPDPVSAWSIQDWSAGSQWRGLSC